MNNNFYPSGLSPEEPREYSARQRSRQPDQGRSMGMMNAGSWGGLHQEDPLSSMLDPHLSGANSLGNIVNQNSHELQQRRSVTYPFPSSLAQQGDNRLMSMMEFSNLLPGYQFGDMASGFQELASSGAFPGNSAAFSQQDLMAMAGQSDFPMLSSDTMDAMGAFSNLNMGTMAEDPASASLFRSSDFGPTTLNSANANFSIGMPVDSLPASAGNVNQAPGIMLGDGGSTTGQTQAFSNNTGTIRGSSSLALNPNLASIPAAIPASVSNPPSLHSSEPPTPQTTSHAHFTPPSTTTTKSPTPSSTHPKSGAILPARSSNKNPYSASGFDMLRALSYVSTRPNPKISLGAVDLSCSFVVCDATLPDCPIIYVSDSFEELTGYNRHEILGQNCRFLQSPDGKVQKGSRREFVDNGVVRELRDRVENKEECQAAVLNYRKGGGGFLNLLSLIPIPWGDEDEGLRYIVGFQIDLVECPEAVEEVASSSSAAAALDDGEGMEVDYRRVRPPPPPLTTAAERREMESGAAATATAAATGGSGQAATMGVDEVSALIQQFTTGGGAAASDWHRQAWERMLLENADDVVHVLSLKGLFLYISPAGCEKVLEYDVDELMGTSLSGVCHPSDVVPVLRELKEAQQNAAVNIVFRIRRKHSGYMWFESHGTVFGGGEQQAKGRKCVVLVGRERPVFTLRRGDVDAHGGVVGDGEFWSKLSASGLLLYVTSGVRSLLDLEPGELEGTGMQELVRNESRSEFGRAIEQARRGSISSFRHELVHKRGHTVPAQTTFYPGDAGLGRRQKNTASFLIAQTRLMKMPARPAASGGGGSGAEDAMAGAIVAGNSCASGGPGSRQQQFATGSGECQEDDNIFGELRTARCTSWQYELRQMEKVNRLLAEELTQLVTSKKKRKRRRGGGAGGGNAGVRDCANCHRRDTPEWRRGPSGNRDLCNSCGLRWAKQTGKVSPRSSSSRAAGDAQGSRRGSSNSSPIESSPLHRELSASSVASTAASSHLFPPQSQPLLEGGSGPGGGGAEMTAIWEDEGMGGE
ncbi:hypothetical protein MFIFM68171_07469 [Madurella fahalii]|uniref:White collar 1 protein n=1 Tax=Madurella fahalii TaxID=1157608 RepID=A0ABQ0GHL9_9PEZI